jgi:hypothetical protein
VRDDRLLRTEPATNNVYDYGVNKNVEHLPQLRKRMSEIIDSYHDVQQDVLETFIDRGHLRKLAEPTILPKDGRETGSACDSHCAGRHRLRPVRTRPLQPAASCGESGAAVPGLRRMPGTKEHVIGDRLPAAVPPVRQSAAANVLFGVAICLPMPVRRSETPGRVDVPRSREWRLWCRPLLALDTGN